ncbi:hypothetical protein BG015_000703 [Linnemannia schmuckeri]|uniref:Uncharacterized protein n=1 Tax=Linnemannia schmuckeri TaxID=64567 RepID=A0A9P5RR82_9FUNG|nr:hypothetical protein BG015_000703 [Linnemannia schmuckeri]
MSTTAGLALFSLAAIILTRIYVSFNPPDFLRQYRDPDGDYCGNSSSPFRRYHHLRLQVVSESLGSKEDQVQDDNKETEKEERGHENELKQDTSRPVLEHVDEEAQAKTRMDHPGRHTVHVTPRSRVTAALTFTSKQDRTMDDNLTILHHLPNSSPSLSSDHHFYTSLPTIPTTQPRRPWLDLEISNIHYHGSLEPFGTDDEVIKTIHDLQTSGSTSNSNSDGGCSASGYARLWGMTVIWEDGQWCCLEGRTLYILKAVGWTGRVRARVLVDQDSIGATV